MAILCYVMYNETGKGRYSYLSSPTIAINYYILYTTHFVVLGVVSREGAWLKRIYIPPSLVCPHILCHRSAGELLPLRAWACTRAF